MADEPRKLLARLRESELGGDASAVTAFDELETLFDYLQALGCVVAPLSCKSRRHGVFAPCPHVMAWLPCTHGSADGEQVPQEHLV